MPKTLIDYFKEGDKVTFYGAKIENGIVKARHPKKLACWVVFQCANDWENYKKYNGVLTMNYDMKKGWHAPEPKND